MRRTNGLGHQSPTGEFPKAFKKYNIRSDIIVQAVNLSYSYDESKGALDISELVTVANILLQVAILY